MWTLGRALDLPLEIELPADSGLAGTWRPGEHFTPVGAGNRRFACYQCWRILSFTTANNQGWQNYVSHMSDGLLVGSEVERPLHEAPLRRQRREYRKPNRRAPKREAVLQLILQGQRYAQIAKTLRMTYQAVNLQAFTLFKIHGVHSREELIEKLTSGKAKRQIA